MIHKSVDLPRKYGTNNDINPMTKSILEAIRQNQDGIQFTDLCKVCEPFFGFPWQVSTSHRVYTTPWLGDPRVNILNDHGLAKVYQVKQVLKAIDRLLEQQDNGSE